MIQQTPPASAAAPLPVGKLLAWAEAHDIKAVARKGAQARDLLRELRGLYAQDEQLAEAEAEEQRLLQQLEEVRGLQKRLRPRAARTRRSPVRDYVQADVRSWARAAGLSVPATGTVPTTIVDAWRAAQAGGAQ
ncbi:histone-like nucleoid-structuring protein Lsr2 [Streptomyces nitrosporeus]|uniref:Lsr2 family DNA-binding protein n=1 Tax=Streptomyces nitrosporeus TaxID=28894 RepID=UPI0039A33E1A